MPRTVFPDPQPAPWRLLKDASADGSHNMAVDEALLLAVRGGEGARGDAVPLRVAPTLRFYAWSRPTLSLGAHQPSSDADALACRRLGVDLVRRPTGGGAVLHAAELTYSVTGRLGEGVFPFSVVGIYERISEALIAGLASLGVRGEPNGAEARARGEEERVHRREAHESMDLAAKSRTRDAAAGPSSLRASHVDANCFAASSRREILVDGRKLIGSAQVRRGPAFLQHGSILIDWNPSLLAQVLPSPRVAASSRGEDGNQDPSVAAPPITLREILGKNLVPSDIMDAMEHGFRETLSVVLVRGALDPCEAEAVAKLRAFKYLDARWTLEGRVRVNPGS